MLLESETCPLEGLLVIKPKIFSDDRGYFYESYSAKKYLEAGISANFVQDNQSYSRRGVLRGLHFQDPPYAQAKLVRVTQGSVYDVAVDLRSSSPTFGQYFALELNDINHFQFFIPAGFAHGYLVLSEFALFQYKCDEYYHPATEGGIRFDDPNINIPWPMKGISAFEISPKDLILPTFQDYKNRNATL